MEYICEYWTETKEQTFYWKTRSIAFRQVQEHPKRARNGQGLLNFIHLKIAFPKKEGRKSYIQMRLLASIPSHPLMAAERAGYIFIIIVDPEYKISPPETPAKWAQDHQNQARASPPGTACLIGNKMINLSLHICPPASFHTPWSAKTSQMGQSYPATPKISNFPAPNPPSSEQNHLFKIWSHDCLPAYIPTLLHTPALPSGTLGISTTLPANPKDPVGHPNQPRHSGSTLLFEDFWVVGNYPYGCMMLVG